MHVCHVITGLHQGGAETTLAGLIPGLAEAGIKNTVISLTSGGSLAGRFVDQGVTPQYSNLRGVHLPLGIFDLRRRIKKSRCNIVQTWMYHADFFGGLAAHSLGKPVVWNLRRSDPTHTLKRSTRILTRLCSRLSSSIPRAIIAGSRSADFAHRQIGYAPELITAIPNGIDLDRWQSIPAEARRLRNELGIPDKARVIAVIGRLHPVKGHELLLSSLEHLEARGEKPICILCGDGVKADAEPLRAWLVKKDRPSTLHLLGLRSDLAVIYSAADLLVHCSHSEGFPNVVGEAMACGTPCIATNVGDTETIVGDTGVMVPAGDSDAMAVGIEAALNWPEDEIRNRGLRARKRIEECFTLQSTVDRYSRLYQSVLDSHG